MRLAMEQQRPDGESVSQCTFLQAALRGCCLSWELQASSKWMNAGHGGKQSLGAMVENWVPAPSGGRSEPDLLALGAAPWAAESPTQLSSIGVMRCLFTRGKGLSQLLPGGA